MEQYGIQEALRKFTEEVGANLKVKMPAETRRVLKTERVIVIANHPTDTEPIAIFAAMPPRKDAKLIVSDCMINLSKYLDDHLIPVHVRVDEIHTPLGWRPTAFLAHATTEKKVWTSEEAHRFNVKQMQEASRELKKGSLILIFPGRRAKDGRWFPGVGHLLHDANSKGAVYVVNADVSGTSYWDLLRLVPGLGRLMPSIKVSFSRPQKVNSLSQLSGKQIALKLEAAYERWMAQEKN